LYLFVLRRKRAGRALPTEGVILWSMIAALVLLGTGVPQEGKVQGSVEYAEAREARERLLPVAVRTVGLLPGPGGPLFAAAALAPDRHAPAKRGATLMRQVWKFEPPSPSMIDSSPVVVGNRVYIGVIHDPAIEPTGALYCLDRESGRQLWRFNAGGTMK